MKINVSVDVTGIMEDLFYDYAENERSFDLDIKEEIKTDLLNQLKKHFVDKTKDTLNQLITEEVKSEVQKKILKEIDSSVVDFSKNGRIKKYGSSDEDYSVSEWIERIFTEESGGYKKSCERQIRDSAKTLSEEIKGRYDLLFASQLITKINDQGLLKDGVFKSLMQTSK